MALFHTVFLILCNYMITHVSMHACIVLDNVNLFKNRFKWNLFL